jgi:hypothetical protein
MIVFKQWSRNSRGGLYMYRYEGWFLFGILPMYVRRYGGM